MWDLEFDEGLTMVCHVSCKEACIVKGFWTREEDSKLVQYIRSHGEGSWPDVPRKAGLRRCSKSCRLRWRNYLRPDLKRGNYSEEEEHIILKLHARFGNRWSFIARHLPGRTDNEIKNFWNTRMKKKLRTMGIDPETHRMVAPAKIYAPDPIQFRSPGLITPRASRPVGKPLEAAAAASGRMQSIGCSVESRVQVSSKECSPNTSVGSKFFAGVPREAHIYSELNRHLVDGLDMNVLGRIQADLPDLTQEKIKFNHRVQTGIDQWRKGDRSESEQFLTDQAEQFCYYNSVASNSSCSVSLSSSSELQQNNTQTTNTDTGTKLSFVAYNGILSPGTSTGDSDSKQIKSVQEISDQLFSPWAGLIPVISIDNYLQSMDVSGDGSDYFGGFY